MAQVFSSGLKMGAVPTLLAVGERTRLDTQVSVNKTIHGLTGIDWRQENTSDIQEFTLADQVLSWVISRVHRCKINIITISGQPGFIGVIKYAFSQYYFCRSER
jgi:hypothetical protein